MIKQRLSFAFFVIISICATLLFGCVASSNPWVRFIGASVGAMSYLACLAVLYLKAGFDREQGLKIFDWLLIGLDVSMIGAFNWIGAIPLLWFLFVLFPSLVVRIIVAYVLKRQKSVQLKQ